MVLIGKLKGLFLSAGLAFCAGCNGETENKSAKLPIEQQPPQVVTQTKVLPVAQTAPPPPTPLVAIKNDTIDEAPKVRPKNKKSGRKSSKDGPSPELIWEVSRNPEKYINELMPPDYCITDIAELNACMKRKMAKAGYEPGPCHPDCAVCKKFHKQCSPGCGHLRADTFTKPECPKKKGK